MAAPAPGARLFTRSELEPRNHRRDAVFVIDDVVYDVTPFLDEHPGGAEVLIDNAGRDASQCFHDVGHSADAHHAMKKYAVGELLPGERRAVRKEEASRGGGGGEHGGVTPGGLLAACAPPLALAALATLLYVYLFP